MLGASNEKGLNIILSLGKIVVLVALVAVALLWINASVKPNNFLLKLTPFYLIPAFETKWLYNYLHIFTVLPVFLLSFDRRVAFYKTWKYLFPSISIIAVIFIAWDIFFTKIGVWTFNLSYTSGIQFFYLPIEEILFFLTVPFASSFIYECLNHYVKKDWLKPIESILTPSLIVCFFLIGIYNYTKLYSASTFILAGALLLYHYIYHMPAFRSRFYLAYLVSWIPFMLVNGILTGACTQEPIVIYNPEEYLGIRLITIPLDDSIYSFLLLFSTLSLYEYFKKKPAI